MTGLFVLSGVVLLFTLGHGKRLQRQRFAELGGILGEKSRRGLGHEIDTLGRANARHEGCQRGADERQGVTNENFTEKLSERHNSILLF